MSDIGLAFRMIKDVRDDLHEIKYALLQNKVIPCDCPGRDTKVDGKWVCYWCGKERD